MRPAAATPRQSRWHDTGASGGAGQPATAPERMTPDDGGEQLWDSLTGDSEGDSEVSGSVGSPQQQSTDSELELQLQLEQLDWDSGFQPSTSQEWQGCAGWADAPPAAVLQLDSGSSGYASGDSSPSSCASSAVVCCDSAAAVVDLAILAGAGSLGAASTSPPELPRGAWLQACGQAEAASSAATALPSAPQCAPSAALPPAQPPQVPPEPLPPAAQSPNAGGGASEDKHARGHTCPYCKAAVIVDSTAPPAELGAAGSGRFSRYRPRTSKRKDNRLAAWYCKYGYGGPGYCKGCSERFNSHLLRQNAQARRATCSRANPCRPCAAILSNFDITPEDLYANFDSRPRRQGKISHSRGQARENAQQSKDKDKDEDKDKEERPTTDLLQVAAAAVPAQKDGGGDQPAKRRRSTRAAVLGAITAVASLVALCGSTMMRYGGGGGDWDNYDDSGSSSPAPARPLDQRGWTCGATMTSLINGTDDELLLRNVCSGTDPGMEFPCDVNDCAPAGKVLIGQRTCRCDGCFRPGLCGDWVLQGHSLGPIESGRECFVHGFVYEDATWRVPIELPCDECKELGSLSHYRHAVWGGTDATCGGADSAGHIKEDGEGVPTSIPAINSQLQATEACELQTVGMWPQPLASIAELADYYGFDAPAREGVMWLSPATQSAGGSGGEMSRSTLWLYNLATPTELLPSNFSQKMEKMSSSRSAAASALYDAHMLWKFQPTLGVWEPQKSSLGFGRSVPLERSGAATWADSGGSLFLFGGDDVNAGERGLQRTTSDGDVVTNAHRAAADFDFWRFDTNEQKWEPLKPAAAAGSAAAAATKKEIERTKPVLTSTSFAATPKPTAAAAAAGGDASVGMTWPAPRTRATIWVESKSPSRSTSATDSRAIWMFGGMRTTQSYAEPHQGAAAAAWHCQDGTACCYIAGRSRQCLGERATSELWRYRYSYEQRHSSMRVGGAGIRTTLPSRTVKGEWQLVSIQAHELGVKTDEAGAADAGPVDLCTDPATDQRRSQFAVDSGIYSPDRRRHCPEGRVDAGSWASAGGRRGGWIFGGSVLDKLGLHGGATTVGQLRDLWHFDVTESAETEGSSSTGGAIHVTGSWRQVLPDMDDIDPIWPPAWNAPSGWLDEEHEGIESLWISGESGQQHDIIPLCTSPTGVVQGGVAGGSGSLSGGKYGTCDSFQRGALDASGSGRHTDLWRFDLAQESWQHLEAPGFGQPGQEAWRSSWPSKRQRAVLSKTAAGGGGGGGAGVFMFGGIGFEECHSDDADKSDMFGDIGDRPGVMTGLWRWETSRST